MGDSPCQLSLQQNRIRRGRYSRPVDLGCDYVAEGRVWRPWHLALAGGAGRFQGTVRVVVAPGVTDDASSSVVRIRVTGAPASAGLFAGVDQTRVRRVYRNALASLAESKSRSAMT